jgi:fused signal recognition particle receptor
MNDSTQTEGWWKRLSGGLKRTSSSLGSSITALVTNRPLDPETLDALADELVRADLGEDLAARIVDALREGRYPQGISSEEVKAVLAGEIEKTLAPVAKPLEFTARPFVILVAGVNGSGKTTTIGKLAARLRAEGKTVTLVAGDTFRAAAIDQLKIWGERTGGGGVSRHRRSSAEPRRVDERTGKNGARHAQG